MRRLTILLGALAALMLVPAAQAFATAGPGTITVKVEGSGSGEISSIGGFEGAGILEGVPPIKCSYESPGPATGVCADHASAEEGFEGIWLNAYAAPGSKFVEWKVSGERPTGRTDCEWQDKAIQELTEETWNEFGNPFCALYEEEEEAMGAVVATAIFTKEAPSGPTLTITKEGGEGTIASNPAGIECGGKCSASYETGKVVTLTASPASGYMFSSWKGCDKGGAIGRQCTVTMSAAKTVVAKFVPSYSVSVSKSGSGIGKVQSAPGGVLCLVNCSSTAAEFKGGASVTLTAAPSKHFHLVHWTGDCSGSSLTCSLPSLAANKTVGAEFAEDTQFALTLNKQGGGNGTVKADVAGINCGATCTTQVAKYYTGTEVTLTATPGKGSSLKEWTGACSGAGTCKVTMSAAKTVGAKFE